MSSCAYVVVSLVSGVDQKGAIFVDDLASAAAGSTKPSVAAALVLDSDGDTDSTAAESSAENVTEHQAMLLQSELGSPSENVTHATAPSVAAFSWPARARAVVLRLLGFSGDPSSQNLAVCNFHAMRFVDAKIVLPWKTRKEMDTSCVLVGQRFSRADKALVVLTLLIGACSA